MAPRTSPMRTARSARRTRWASLALLALGACAFPGGSRDTGPEALARFTVGPYLERSHSHNDYDRGRPLLDALARGFASVEVDVALLDGELYVVHDAEDASPSRPTLVGSYLEPLRSLVTMNGGSIYGPDAPPLQLLIDVKSDAWETHTVLHQVLASYDDVLTSWTDGGARARPVVAVLSGRRALEALREEPVRYAAIDGRIYERREGVTVDEMPLVSINWDDTVGRFGSGARGERMARAREMVATVHAEGRQVRFWNTPEEDRMWRSLTNLGVDYIGADGIDRLRRFLVRARSSR